MLTGSVSEGSFSRNCTMQYASWRNRIKKKERMTKLEILDTKDSKDILLKLPKKFQTLVLVTSRSIHFKNKKCIKQNKKLLFQAKH